MSSREETEIRALRLQVSSFNQEISRLLLIINGLRTELAQARAERKSLG